MLARLAAHLRPLGPAGAAASAPAEEGGDETPWWDGPVGTKRTYFHPVPGADAWAPGRGLPTLVVRGDRPGPTLLVTAGVHGDEYEPMAAIQRVFGELQPAELAGTVVMVSCCNVDAYLSQSREAQVDGANLARVFPGSADGTLTERVRAPAPTPAL